MMKTAVARQRGVSPGIKLRPPPSHPADPKKKPILNFKT